MGKKVQLTGNKAIQEIRSLEKQYEEMDAIYWMFWELEFGKPELYKELDKQFSGGEITNIGQLSDFFKNEADHIHHQARMLVPYINR